MKRAVSISLGSKSRDKKVVTSLLGEEVTKRLDITGRGLNCPFPEIGMDIDKPHQLEIAFRELA